MANEFVGRIITSIKRHPYYSGVAALGVGGAFIHADKYVTAYEWINWVNDAMTALFGPEWLQNFVGSPSFALLFALIAIFCFWRIGSKAEKGEADAVHRETEARADAARKETEARKRAVSGVEALTHFYYQDQSLRELERQHAHTEQMLSSYQLSISNLENASCADWSSVNNATRPIVASLSVFGPHLTDFEKWVARLPEVKLVEQPLPHSARKLRTFDPLELPKYIAAHHQNASDLGNFLSQAKGHLDARRANIEADRKHMEAKLRGCS